VEKLTLTIKCLWQSPSLLLLSITPSHGSDLFIWLILLGKDCDWIITSIPHHKNGTGFSCLVFNTGNLTLVFWQWCINLNTDVLHWHFSVGNLRLAFWYWYLNSVQVSCEHYWNCCPDTDTLVYWYFNTAVTSYHLSTETPNYHLTMLLLQLAIFSTLF